MKNTDRNQEFGSFGGSYPSFICVYPVDLWFYFSKFLFRMTASAEMAEGPAAYGA